MDDYELKENDPPAKAASPPPLPALPSVASMPPALPAQALSYPSPWRHSRPGLITAIGVISIIVACVSALSSLGQGTMTFGLMAMSRATAAMKAATLTAPMPPPVASGPATAPGAAAPEIASSNGLEPDDRQVVEQLVESLQPLNESQHAELDHFLASNGQSMFPTAGRALTANQVKLAVTRSGNMAGAGDDDPAHTFFVTGWGTLNVYDQKAVFTPADRTLPATTTSVADDNTAGVVLSRAVVSQMLAGAQSMTGNAMDAGQVTAFKAALQNPQLQLNSPFGLQGVQSAYRMPDGSVTVRFLNGGMVTLGPNGTAVNVVAAPPMGMPTFQFKQWLCALVIIDAIFSGLLAIYLLVAGIQVMREAPSAARLHWIYVWIKIPLAILGGLAMIWMWMDFGAGVASSTGQPGVAPAIQATYGTMSGMMTLAALIYPIALLFVLRSKTVREYFNAVE